MTAPDTRLCDVHYKDQYARLRSSRTFPSKAWITANGDKFDVGQLRGDPHRWSLRPPARVVYQQIVDRDVQCGSESVQVGVHAKFLQDQWRVQHKSWALSRITWWIIARTARTPWSQSSSCG
jgi:hypothetical protein